MQYVSTRDSSLRYSASQAIVQGLSRDGGLFLPETIPVLSLQDLKELRSLPYVQRAARIMKLFLDEFTLEELTEYAQKAYRFGEKFDTPQVIPIVAVEPKTYLLELWHGPTSAFKDLALQMLPYLLTAALKKTGQTQTACILVATSGDTGKAALEGFRDVAHTKILVFYPEKGVSEMQELQMRTQAGDNVGVYGVKGNFDDAQTGVKKIFSDPHLREKLANGGYFLSSANSINWGRVLPQIVYYVSGYCDLVNQGAVAMGEKINVCVPTGNFGNILAAFYAKQMGVPIGRFLSASNENNVLTEFIRSGCYNRNRPFYHTVSPSMDILISSNLERLLYLFSRSDAEVRRYMEDLTQKGVYTVLPERAEQIQSQFSSGDCNDAVTLQTIGQVFSQTGYLMDTHTAVGYHVLQSYREKTGDETVTLLASTASPFKFSSDVLKGLGVTNPAGGFMALEQLAEKTGKSAPSPLAGLRGMPVRFSRVVAKEEMAQVVQEMLL